jgi:dGTPase
MPKNQKSMYGEADSERLVREDESADWRSAWRRDYARVIHSPSFRRLQNKTQLFYGSEVDSIRNRLTHSLEVAQIAKSIAQYINHEVKKFKDNDDLKINPDIVEIAGLVHDLGHPPFGHNGEKALDECSKLYGGFEGNAQTLRILAKLEKRRTLNEDDKFGFDSEGHDNRAGLNLTYRVVASALKYDSEIPQSRKSKAKFAKGYYHTERELVKSIKEKVLGTKNFRGEFKTIECQIMDIADDIAYSTYDLEDAFKSGFLNPLDMLDPGDEKISKIQKKISEGVKPGRSTDEVREVLRAVLMGIFKPTQKKVADNLNIKEFDNDRGALAEFLVLSSVYTYQDAVDLASNGYRRSTFTSALVNKHIYGIEVDTSSKYPALWKVNLNEETRFMVEVLKQFAYVSIIESPRLKIPEYRGYDVVKTIFKAISNDKRYGYNLLPEDFRTLYLLAKTKRQKVRLVVDFVSGMTDRYAIDFYNKLVSDVPQTIFGPI